MRVLWESSECAVLNDGPKTVSPTVGQGPWSRPTLPCPGAGQAGRGAWRGSLKDTGNRTPCLQLPESVPGSKGDSCSASMETCLKTGASRPNSSPCVCPVESKSRQGKQPCLRLYRSSSKYLLTAVWPPQKEHSWTQAEETFREALLGSEHSTAASFSHVWSLLPSAP